MLPQYQAYCTDEAYGEASMQVRVNPDTDGPDVVLASTPNDDVLLIRQGAVPPAIMLQLGVVLADAKVCRQVLQGLDSEPAAIAG